MNDKMKIECPICNQQVELNSIVGTYYGICDNCKDNGKKVGFTVMVNMKDSIGSL